MTISQIFHTIGQVYTQSFPPKATFSAEQVPDLSGRVCIVTGGYAGIGKETVKALLKKNAKVYVAGRSKAKAEPVIQELKGSTEKEAIFLELDLADPVAIRRSVKEFLEKESELHILFNNAGVMSCPMELTTPDGYDLQFGTNVIGHWYFTELLMPALLRGKETSPDKHARVITTSSISSFFSTIQWNTLKDGPARRRLFLGQLYAQSKFGNVLVAREVARRYGDQGIISIPVNPGNIRTDLYKYTWKIPLMMLDLVTLRPPPLGALTQLYAGTMPEALQHNGEFYVPWARLGRTRPEAYDVELGKKLWEWLEASVKKE